NLSVFNGTNEFASIATGGSPYYALFNPSDGDMFVSNQASGNISVVNGSTVVASPVVGLYPGISTYDPKNQYVYVPNTGSNNVSILSGTTVIANVSAGNSPTEAVYDPSNGWVYVVNSLSNNITIINGTALQATIPGGGSPNRGGYDPANGDVYVADTGSNSVLVINGTTQLANLSVGVFPRNIVYDAATQEVFVPDWIGDSVTVINGTTVVATVSVGLQPFSATYDPGTSEVYVVNFNTANLSVLGNPANSSNVTFHETGLPNGTLWGARVGPTSFTTNTSSVTFPEPNASYNYTVLPVHAFAPLVGSGTFSMTGSPVVVNVTFVPSYPITFTESGLGPGEYWNVTIPPAWNGSVNVTNVLWEPNGSYAYTIEPVAGYVATWTGNVNVSGAATGVNVSFVQVVYPVTFQETGLTPGTYWQAGISGATNNSVTADVIVWEPNGSYTYQIPAVPGYVVGLSSGPVAVNGTGPTVPVAFTRTFSVTFLEHGLPTNSTWSIRVGSATASTNSSSILLPETNGSYGYAVSTNRTGFHANSTFGSFDVQGFAMSVDVNFSANATGPANYTVVFEAGGLPANVVWTVHFGALTNSSSGLVHSFLVPNGSYSFTASAPGYTATPSMGSILVNGPGSFASPIRLTFQAVVVAPPARNYTVSFVEEGLTEGTSWAVEVNSTTVRGTGMALDFQEANGTHTYRVVGAVPGFATTWAGQFVVAGANRSVGVNFHLFLYQVQFTETGLSSGTNWNVTLGVDSNASGDTTLTFQEPNGTYSYTFAAVSEYAGPPAGSVVVNGSNPGAIAVEFHPNSSAPATFLGLPAFEGLALLGLVGVVAIAAAAWLLRQRSRSRISPPPSLAEEQTPTETDLEP
ncbi:MAG: YncE family protein, partial [Thermoplasmata archaeon]|nr:YncE family protein [Thermoplasmata archaeon]